ncbi:MAG: hypothetical protein Q4C42_10110 [Clostridia bacterium]|nr:hypothetical protein [Clostridia bacterium]
MTDFGTILEITAGLVPFILTVLLANGSNLKKPIRSRQFPMPFIGLIAATVYLIKIDSIVREIENLVAYGADTLGQVNGFLASLFANMRSEYWILIIANTALLLAYLAVKKVLVGIFSLVFKTGNSLYENVAGLFYDYDSDKDIWYLRKSLTEVRKMLKVLYISVVVLSCIFTVGAYMMYLRNMISGVFYPVYGIILISEIFQYLNGLTKEEYESQVLHENPKAAGTADYSIMRDFLRKLFPDKLNAEDTAAASYLAEETLDTLITSIENSRDRTEEIYGRFMRRLYYNNVELDRNYIHSGLDLLRGKSVLFNNPFYNDYTPYIFYPMNRTLLKHRKVLVILGRNSTEENVREWLTEGFTSVNSAPELWKTDKLTADADEYPDVGIITRSDVHNLKLHEKLGDFFREVEFVVVLEPSKLLSTAQIGFSSIARKVNEGFSKPVWCTIDKNCDGLVDALSHVLLTELTEVSATEKSSGVASYMLWDADGDNVQHRIVPNISRYLGFGTELSMAALRNQIPETNWYGGEAFPVKDIHWIAGQYYHELLNYANIPEAQENLNAGFKASSDMWSASKKENAYITAEDEANNMFEMQRDFATRAKDCGFVNILSGEYLLKDYMANNSKVFETDPKAIPYIVPDYVRSHRNIALRLIVMMCSGMLSELQIKHELSLINENPESGIDRLWEIFCENLNPVSKEKNRFIVKRNGKSDIVFGRDIILEKPKYNMDCGRVIKYYFIKDSKFIQTVVSDLQSAEFVAEDELDYRHYIGAELIGHIYQKYLPGQYFTLDGKYYEMLSVTSLDKMLVRRAADHIFGRPSYRQVRNYALSNFTESKEIGSVKNIDGMKISRLFADISVDTPAYWIMNRHNDFKTAKYVTINGVPSRFYSRKQVIKIELPDEEEGKPVSREICRTVTVLFNELFRTVFAENDAYISAVLAGEKAEKSFPLTYSLDGDESNAIYIIEDSQLDLGLLVAFERNIKRFFEIICDYLEWDKEETEKDEDSNDNEAPEKATVTVETHEEKRKGIFGLFKAIGDWFKKLGKKKKVPEEASEIDPETVGQQAEVEGENSAENTGNSSDDASVTNSSESTMLFSEGEPKSDSAEMNVEFEKVERINSASVPKRKPYKERRYLLYGFGSGSEFLKENETLEYLRKLRYNHNSLNDARKLDKLAEFIENGTNGRSHHRCDFCGRDLSGIQFDTLADGRERCSECSKTSVKSLEEFNRILETVLKNLNAFYHVRINVPVNIKVVNAKKLHKSLNRTFVPTGDYDGRILGVAIKDKNGYSILIENGAPRLQSTMTLVHELTHIWQYINWKEKVIQGLYAPKTLEIYEGMAKWAEIEYAYLIKENSTAMREELVTRARNDEYGEGFRKFADRYPLTRDLNKLKAIPFEDVNRPL